MLREPRVEFLAKDLGLRFERQADSELVLDGQLNLHKAVYNRLVRQFNQGRPLYVRMTTYSDAPPGSGLGSSSSMVVAMLTAFRSALSLPLGEYDLAHLAHDIERFDCGMAGGKQDQYAATFGGFNFIEFHKDDRVVVNPLRIRRHIENELQCRLMLYFTGLSRQVDSARIIADQIRSAQNKDRSDKSLEAMHEIRELTFAMKERLLKGDLDGMAQLFRQSWEAKKKLSGAISNERIEAAATAALAAGARAVKVSGAGGGGFLMLFADPTERVEIDAALSKLGGFVQRFQFTHAGAEAWEVK
jgi:D-glycero-alpha-D-manno-heptose-7-phosphate kinase